MKTSLWNSQSKYIIPFEKPCKPNYYKGAGSSEETYHL